MSRTYGMIARKNVIKQVRIVVETVIEINYLRPSMWISRVSLNECVYYVIWDHLVFSSSKGLWAKSNFTEKVLSKCTLTQSNI